MIVNPEQNILLKSMKMSLNNNQNYSYFNNNNNNHHHHMISYNRRHNNDNHDNKPNTHNTSNNQNTRQIKIIKLSNVCTWVILNILKRHQRIHDSHSLHTPVGQELSRFCNQVLIRTLHMNSGKVLLGLWYFNQYMGYLPFPSTGSRPRSHSSSSTASTCSTQSNDAYSIFSSESYSSTSSSSTAPHLSQSAIPQEYYIQKTCLQQTMSNHRNLFTLDYVKELLVAVFSLADIYTNDVTYSCKAWSNYSHIPVSRIIETKRQVLIGLQYDLNLRESTFMNWLRELREIASFEQVSQQQQQQQFDSQFILQKQLQQQKRQVYQRHEQLFPSNNNGNTFYKLPRSSSLEHHQHPLYVHQQKYQQHTTSDHSVPCSQPTSPLFLRVV